MLAALTPEDADQLRAGLYEPPQAVATKPDGTPRRRSRRRRSMTAAQAQATAKADADFQREMTGDG